MVMTALITGASGGIGLELAKLFAKDGYDLILVARNEEKLLQVAVELGSSHNIRASVCAVDLSKADGPSKLYAMTQDLKLNVDVLVNNAGFGQFGHYEELDAQGELEQIQLNVMSLTQLTKLFLKPMIARQQGRILNVASTAGFQPGPLMSVYYATKAYVISYSMALANELRPKGIFVTCLCPGPTLTNFQSRASMKESMLLRFSRMQAEQVAEVGYKAILKGKPLVIVGVFNWLLTQSTRFFPRTWVTSISRKLLEPHD